MHIQGKKAKAKSKKKAAKSATEATVFVWAELEGGRRLGFWV